MFTANHFLEAFRRPLTSACDCPADRQAGHSQVFNKAKTSTSCKSFNYSSTIALPSSGMFNEIVYSKVRPCYWSIKEEAQDTHSVILYKHGNVSHVCQSLEVLHETNFFKVSVSTTTSVGSLPVYLPSCQDW